MMTIDELNRIKQATLPNMSLRDGTEGGENIKSTFKKQVLLCRGTGCTSSKSDLLEKKFRELIAEKKLEAEIDIVKVGCFGLCEAGPIVVVYPEGTFYSHITLEQVDRIVEEDLIGGNIIRELLYKGAIDEADKIKSLNEVQFYAKQERIALRNCGLIDAECIEEHIAYDGYFALYKA